jgi:D-alanine-D-alanine ligase
MPRPYVVKPANEGSSVGVHIVRTGDNRPPLDEAGDGEFMVERYIEGRELTVAVMGERALAVTELRPRQGFYDYHAKYTAGATQHLVPAPVARPVYDAAMAMACAAHQALGCRGVSRADLRFDERGGPEGLYLLEVNTQPGMTPLSLVPEQAAHVGIDFGELVAWMVERARWGA